MSNKRLLKYLSQKKGTIMPVEQDKDFVGEMVDHINESAKVENTTQNREEDGINEQESDGSASAFGTK